MGWGKVGPRHLRNNSTTKKIDIREKGQFRQRRLSDLTSMTDFLQTGKSQIIKKVMMKKCYSMQGKNMMKTGTLSGSKHNPSPRVAYIKRKERSEENG